MLGNIRPDHLSICLSVCLSVRKVYCGKTADWIRNAVWNGEWGYPGIHVLDGVHLPQGEGVDFGVIFPH